jgi:cell division septal protein FtsQ
LHHDNVIAYPKRARRRGVGKTPWLLLIFFLCILTALYLASPLALVQDISVTGNVVLSREEILATAGLDSGQHIWRLNLAKSRDKLSLNPWVLEVRIVRVFPNSLAITVQEREGVAIIADSGEHWVAAGDGIILTPYAGHSLPWITGLAPGQLEPGSSVEGQVAATALEWVIALQPLDSQISELNFSLYPAQVTLFTTDGYKVIFPADSDLEQRVRDLNALLQVLRAENRKGIIDFRSGAGRGVFSPWPGADDGDS